MANGETRIIRGPIDLPQELWQAPKADQDVWRSVTKSMGPARQRLQETRANVNFSLWDNVIILDCYALLVNRNDPTLQNPTVDQLLVDGFARHMEDRTMDPHPNPPLDENALLYLVNYAGALYHYLHPQSNMYSSKNSASLVKEIRQAKPRPASVY